MAINSINFWSQWKSSKTWYKRLSSTRIRSSRIPVKHSLIFSFDLMNLNKSRGYCHRNLQRHEIPRYRLQGQLYYALRSWNSQIVLQVQELSYRYPEIPFVSITVRKGKINCLLFYGKSNRLLSCAEDTRICSFDVQTRSLVHVFEDYHYGSGYDKYSLFIEEIGVINSIAMSKKRIYLASGSADCSVKVYNLQDDRLNCWFSGVHKRKALI